MNPEISAEKVVQRQLDAYNNRDINAFMATYHEGAELFNFPNEPYLTGRAAMRIRYGKLFEISGLHAKILGRISVGNFVTDHEVVTGSGGLHIEAIAIYEVRNELIQRVWFIKA